MTKCAPLWRLLLSLFLAFSFAGCSQFKRADVAEEKDPHFLDAKRRQSMKDTNGAIDSFERALQSNPRNATAHLELGLIYESRPTNQASAIYHFEKFLNFRTNSPQSTLIREKIAYAKRSLATLEAPINYNRSVQAELEKLVTANQNYAKRIEQLQAELDQPRYITNYVTNWVAVNQEQQRKGAMTWPTEKVEPPPTIAKASVSSSGDKDEPDPTPRTDQKSPRTVASTDTKAANGNRSAPPSSTPSGSRTQRNQPAPQTTRRAEPQQPTARARTVHTVRPGDTLARVAQRYGISIAELRKANPNASKGAVAGQKLVIPQK